jgi:hypothetical protein
MLIVNLQDFSQQSVNFKVKELRKIVKDTFGRLVL